MMVIDNREEVEGIIDLGSQIIAMSEAVSMTSAWCTTHPSSSICSQPMAR
jgi:hypothetical protein